MSKTVQIDLTNPFVKSLCAKLDKAEAENGQLREEIYRLRDERDTFKLTNERMRAIFKKMLSPAYDWYDGEIGVGHGFRALAREVLGLPDEKTIAKELQK